MTVCACMYPECAKAGRCLADSGGRYERAELLPIFYERAPPEPKCSPTMTECPRCKNDISKCAALTTQQEK